MIKYVFTIAIAAVNSNQQIHGLKLQWLKLYNYNVLKSMTINNKVVRIPMAER